MLCMWLLHPAGHSLLLLLTYKWKKNYCCCQSCCTSIEQYDVIKIRMDEREFFAVPILPLYLLKWISMYWISKCNFHFFLLFLLFIPKRSLVSLLLMLMWYLQPSHDKWRYLLRQQQMWHGDGEAWRRQSEDEIRCQIGLIKPRLRRHDIDTASLPRYQSFTYHKRRSTREQGPQRWTSIWTLLWNT